MTQSRISTFIAVCLVWSLLSQGAQAQYVSQPMAAPISASTAEFNEAQFVSQTVPRRMQPGETRTVSITMMNTGSTTWSRAGEFKLGTENPGDNELWIGSTRVYLSGADVIEPGQSKTFTFDIVAPSVPGVYDFQWRMVQDPIEWFGEFTPNVEITVVEAPAPFNGAQFVSQNVPDRMQPGETKTVSIAVRNTGTTTWTRAGGYKLGAENPRDNTLWTGSTRVYLSESDVVAPEQSKTFTFAITAPTTPGVYNFRWRMVQDPVEWFGEFTPNVSITVEAPAQANGAQFISQDVPSQLQPGERRSVSITIRNAGATTWSQAGGYKLGTENPRDNILWTGSTRVYLSESDVVKPGQSKTFTFDIVAPSVPGVYYFQWRMVQDPVEWFGEFTLNIAITVATNEPCQPLEAPAPLQPVGGIDTPRPTFSWSAAVGAGSYTLEVYQREQREGDPAEDVLVLRQADIRSTAFALTDTQLPADVVLRWRVQAVDACGSGPFSDFASFFVTLAPPLPFPVRPGLWPASGEESSGDDLDQDGIPQITELRLAQAFFPTIWYDPGEDCVLPGGSRGHQPNQPGRIVFRVRPHPRNANHIAITYVLLYTDDCGDVLDGGHHGDVEPFAITLAPDAACESGYGIYALRSWAHEGTLVENVDDRSFDEPRCRFGFSIDPTGREDVVLAAENKHGNYLYLSTCDAGGVFGSDHCGLDFTLGDVNAWVGFNTGEPGARRHRDLGPLGFPGEEIWAGQDFCGGLSRSSDCPGAVENKLTDKFVAATFITETPANKAQFVDQAGVPSSMRPGQQATVVITMKNTGATTWDPDANYSLGSQNPENNWTWGLARAPLDSPVAPGQQVTFHFAITAPTTPGTYNFQWRMVQEHVEWFGDPTPNVVIQTGSAGDNAEMVSNTIPTSMVSGESNTVRVTVLNTGVSTWTRDGDGPRDGSQGFKLVVIDGNLIPVGIRYSLPPGVEVPPGESFTFEFTIVAPFFEFATTSLQMIHEGVGLFGEVLFVSVEIQQVELPPSTISVNPTSGSPGTFVTVNLVEGNAFHPFSEVAFSFGDPEAHDYSRTPVRTTWVNDSQMTFSVPPDAGCGAYFVTVFAPAAPEVRVSKSARFTLTSPCNPERRNSLDVFTYNVHLLPTAGHMDYRAGLIAYHPELRGHDVVVLVEAMSDSHRQTITYALRPEYPYQGRILGSDHWKLFPPNPIPIPIQDGGVIILSKWPIEGEAQTLFGDLCTFFPDCLGDKGVNYAKINKAGQRYHVFGTHLDSGPEADDVAVRNLQLQKMAQFIRSRGIGRDAPVLMAGDFNVDRNHPSGEYERMLRILSATQPPIYGIRYSTNPKGEWLDYVFYSNEHLQPSSALNWVRLPRDGNGGDLSDHYAVLGSFVFSVSEVLAVDCSAAPTEAPVVDQPSGTLSTPFPVFTWNEIPGARSYTLSVIRVRDGATLFRQRKIAGTSFAVDSPLPSGVDLRWEVKGENSCGEGPNSSSVRFRIDRNESSAPTAAPIPNWPGGSVSNSTPTFSWRPVDGATVYSLHVLTVRGEEVVLDKNNINGTSFTPDSPLPGGEELFWTVTAESEFGPGPYSPSVYFRAPVKVFLPVVLGNQ